jgi:hypothetical protein
MCLPLVKPTLQPFRLLRQNLNIAWWSVPVFMKLGKSIIPHETISVTYNLDPPLQQIQHYSLSDCWGNSLNVTYYSNARTKFRKTWYIRVYHAIWGLLNAVIHKSFPSVIPTLRPAQNLVPHIVTYFRYPGENGFKTWHKFYDLYGHKILRNMRVWDRSHQKEKKSGQDQRVCRHLAVNEPRRKRM